ncbi:MAG: hypothetical protein FOGNACKC_00802 [Anaerolineae bacterium]|nr:hypothetical protein [Anaerolineae bacterium]
MAGLTNRQMEQLDVVDGVVLAMLQELSPVELEYGRNISAEHVEAVRDAVIGVLCDDLKVITEMELYPYIEQLRGQHE